jgi:hypothetical protein
MRLIAFGCVFGFWRVTQTEGWNDDRSISVVRTEFAALDPICNDNFGGAQLLELRREL